MPVGLNPNIQTTKTQQTQGTQQGQTKVNTGGQGEDAVAGEFQEKSKFSMKGANGNTGLTYTASPDKAGGGMDQSSVDSQLKKGDNAISDGKGAASKADKAGAKAGNDHKTFLNDHKQAMNDIDGATNSIKSDQAKIDSSSGRLGQITAKQDNIKAWIENNSPGVEEMTVKMQELTDEAFAMIADAGIQEEFGSLDEAMEAIAQVMEDCGGEDAMKIIEEKTAERDSLAEEVEGMADDDPEKAAKMEELDTLNAGLEPGGEFNPTTDLGIDLAALSELQANLGDTMAAIGELSANIDAYHDTLDSKQSELDGLQNNAASENSNIENSNKNIKTTSSQVAQWVDDRNGAEQENTESSNGLQLVGDMTKEVGGVVTGIGAALLAATPTAAKGIIVTGIGISTTGTGMGIRKAGDKQLEETNKSIQEDNKQAQLDYDAQGKAEAAKFSADQMAKLDAASAKNTGNTIAQSRQKTQKPIGPSGGTEGA